MDPSDESAARQAQFRDAVDRCDLTAAAKLCEKDWKVRTEGVAYVVKKKPLRFIINFIERIKHLCKQTLVALYRTGSKTAIEAVIEEVEFPKQYLLHAASTCTLMRSPENFINLLNKVPPEDHKDVVEKGIKRLFWNRRTHYIGPLLAALEDRTFQGESLKDIAIQQLFYSEIYGYDDNWLKRIYNHPAITSDIYTHGILRNDRHPSQLGWLLDVADRDDLEAARDDLDRHWNPDAKLRDTIEQALLTAKPGGTRHGTWQNTEIANEAANGITNYHTTEHKEGASNENGDKRNERGQ